MERHDLRWFEHYMPTDGSVTITNRTSQTAVLGVCGAYSTGVWGLVLTSEGLPPALHTTLTRTRG